MGGSTSSQESVLQEIQVECIACGARLTFLPDAYPLFFQCENGHFHTLATVLDGLLSDQVSSTAQMAECWEKNAALLRRMAGRALALGHVFAAADFQETAQRIYAWVARLRTLNARAGAVTSSPAK